MEKEMAETTYNSSTPQYTLPDALRPFLQHNSIAARSPGRINLIGEHTDYNNGFVLPAAIDKAAYIVITPRADQEIHLYSADMDERYHTTVEALAKSDKMSWPNYILGVVQQFVLAGIAVTGFDAALTGDVPIGAGLSSSAAVECAVALAMNTLYAASFDKLSMVKMAQRAENVFVGVQCGIMDQFASMFGKQHHVIRLDCRSLDYTYVPFKLEGIKILLLDTNVKHSLGSTAYNVRRQQCETGVSWIQRHEPQVSSLRDVTMEMLDKYVLHDDILIYQRCKYVIEENQRLLAACEDLQRNDIASFGERMFETHYGLSKLYEVSCPELDFLVSQVQDNPNVIGARMMGGGFGGCTINLVKEEAIEELVATTAQAYETVMQKKMKSHVAVIEGGSILISF